MSKVEIELSAIEIIEYMLETNSSLRQTAKHFNCSKSLIWSRINDYEGELKNDINKLKVQNKVKSYEKIIKRGQNNGKGNKENYNERKSAKIH